MRHLKRPPVSDDDLERLRREKAKLKEEDETLKKQPATLRGSEVAVHRGQPPQLSGQGDVPDFKRIYQWLLCGPLSPAQPKSPAANPTDRLSFRAAAVKLWCATYSCRAFCARHSCCENTVAKLTWQAQIMPKAIRQFRVTTDARNTEASPNLINRAFQMSRHHACWLSDITYVPTRSSWLYLVAILDFYSRAVVGWAMSKTLVAKLATEALKMAINHRRTAPGHSALRSRVTPCNNRLPVVADQAMPFV